MSYEDDPEIRAARAESSARAALWRSAIIWGPLFLIAFGALVFFGIDEATGGDRGSWFLVVLLAFFSLLLGVQAGQAVRDLAGQPRELVGFVTRRWSRTDSLVMRSHYIRVEDKIFRLDRARHGEYEEGDYVWVRYYPHSATIIVLEIRPQPAEGEEAT